MFKLYSTPKQKYFVLIVLIVLIRNLENKISFSNKYSLIFDLVFIIVNPPRLFFYIFLPVYFTPSFLYVLGLEERILVFPYEVQGWYSRFMIVPPLKGQLRKFPRKTSIPVSQQLAKISS